MTQPRVGIVGGGVLGTVLAYRLAQSGANVTLATSKRSRSALTSRAEVPKPKGNVARARGTFVATAAKEGTTGAVTWRLTFSCLTGPALAAHIHIGRAGRAGRVAVPLCSPCRNGQHGSAVLDAATLVALETGPAYVNIHTRRNPAGEVRGQIPASALSLG